MFNIFLENITQETLQSNLP